MIDYDAENAEVSQNTQMRLLGRGDKEILLDSLRSLEE